MTNPYPKTRTDIVIKALREENLQLKLEVLRLKGELPTDPSTRKKQFERVIHNEEIVLKKILPAG